MVRVTVEALESGSTASLEDGDSTIVTASDGEVEITVDVQSPTWAEFDTIEFYLNSTTIRNVTPDVETGAGEVDVNRYQIAPDVIHGTADVIVKDQLFTRTTQSVSGGSRFEATTTLTLAGGSALSEDTWIVVMVKGTDGVSKPLFPMIPNSLQQSGNTTLADLTDGNLGEDGILALAFTNPIFVDVDGGGYDAPGVQCVTEDPPHPTCVTTSTTTTTTTSSSTTTL
jgi:hypothetical protein